MVLVTAAPQGTSPEKPDVGDTVAGDSTSS